MKVLLALAVLATTATAFADTQRAIYDVMYLPKAGTTYGISQGEYITAKIKGDGFSDVKFDGYRITQTIGHSFTDRLLLSAALNYTDITVDGTDGDNDSTSSGVSDPRVDARFRVMDENFVIDIVGGALISRGDSEVESDNDSNNLQGGSSFNAGVQFGQKFDSVQWAVLGQLTHNLERTTEFDDGDDVKDDSNNAFLLKADVLNKFTEKSMLRSFASVDFAQGYDDNDDNQTAAATTYGLGTEYQHLCSENLLVRAGIDYNSTNANSGFIDSFDIWTYRVGANYQF
jgi:hypothetical protein